MAGSSNDPAAAGLYYATKLGSEVTLCRQPFAGGDPQSVFRYDEGQSANPYEDRGGRPPEAAVAPDGRSVAFVRGNGLWLASCLRAGSARSPPPGASRVTSRRSSGRSPGPSLDR